MRIDSAAALIACVFIFHAASYLPLAKADPYQPTISKQQEQQLDKARAIRRGDQKSQSIPLLQQLVKENPEYYLASYNLALAYGETGAYEKSISEFNRAIQIQEKHKISDPTIFNSLGWAYWLAGNVEGAEAALKKAEAQFERLGTASKQKLLNNLGVLYQNKQDYVKAEFYYRRAAEGYSSTLAKDNLKVVQALKQEQAQANWFPVIASVYREEQVASVLKKLKGRASPHELHVYEATDIKGTPVYAISLGGYLTKEEANKRSEQARSTNLAKDSYIWKSETWGANIIGKFPN